MYDRVLRSARIVTPEGVVVGDLGIEGERIAAIGQGLGPGREEVDATGRVIFPGAVDAQVHLGTVSRGIRSADGMESGTRAALFGGSTTLIDFLHQEPGEELLSAFERHKREIEQGALADVALHASLSSFSEESLGQMPELIARGVRSFKVLTAQDEAEVPLRDQEILRIAEVLGKAGGLLMLRAENGDAVEYLSRYLNRAGLTAASDFVSSRPDLMEAESIYRVATLARLAGCPLYIAPLSTSRGLDLIRGFREENWEIHTETCPHYLLLDQALYEGEAGYHYITSPPLRGARDRQALFEAVINGEIDVISSAHAPFSRAKKNAGEGGFPDTPMGLGGVETRFPLMFSHLVSLGDGGLTPRSNATLLLLARVLAENPARIFGLAPRKGALREGADADFILFDPDPIRQIRAGELHGACDWTPFEGFEVRGEILAVYRRGSCVVEGGKLNACAGEGCFVPGRS